MINSVFFTKKMEKVHYCKKSNNYVAYSEQIVWILKINVQHLVVQLPNERLKHN